MSLNRRSTTMSSLTRSKTMPLIRSTTPLLTSSSSPSNVKPVPLYLNVKPHSNMNTFRKLSTKISQINDQRFELNLKRKKSIEQLKKNEESLMLELNKIAGEFSNLNAKRQIKKDKLMEVESNIKTEVKRLNDIQRLNKEYNSLKKQMSNLKKQIRNKNKL